MVEAQEVESFGASCKVRDPGLLGMQSQPECGQSRRGLLAGLDGLLAGRAQDDEVVRVTRQHSQSPPLGRPRLIEDVQGDVGEQR
jgi:hypothetical protein